jgi:exopolysaccharide biosynthesis operon protein EpsL
MLFPSRSTIAAVASLASLGTLVLWAPEGLADYQDTWNLFVSESLYRDNNLFRLPSGVSPAEVGLGSGSRSDTVRTDLVGLRFDKPYGLQRLSVTASLANYQFSNYGFLDYQAKNLEGRWNWALTPTLAGNIGAGRKQTLASFADYQTYIRNVRTTDNLRAGAEYGVRGPWRLLVAADQTEGTDSVPQVQTWDTRTQAMEAGIKYVSAAGNSFSYLLRENRVHWLNRPLDPLRQFDNQARQTDHEFGAEVQTWPKARLKGSIAHIERRHDTMTSRDYGGTAGHLDLAWTPTAALKLDVLARREHGSWWDNNASHTLTERLAISPSWQISTKLALRGRIEQANRDFIGPVVEFASPQRQDVTRSGLVALDWMPWRSVTLSASWQADRRHSSRAGFDFNDVTAGVSAQLGF